MSVPAKMEHDFAGRYIILSSIDKTNSHIFGLRFFLSYDKHYLYEELQNQYDFGNCAVRFFHNLISTNFWAYLCFTLNISIGNAYIFLLCMEAELYFSNRFSMSLIMSCQFRLFVNIHLYAWLYCYFCDYEASK